MVQHIKLMVLPIETRLAPVAVDNDPGSDVPVHAGQVTNNPPESHKGQGPKERPWEGVTAFADMIHMQYGTHSYCAEPCANGNSVLYCRKCTAWTEMRMVRDALF